MGLLRRWAHIDNSIDMTAIKAEYIATDISYRALAEKYGIPKRTIEDMGRREGWVGLRSQARGDIVAKTVEATIDAKVSQAVKINEVADQLLDIISDTLAAEGSNMHPQHLKWYTSALKDLRDIKGVKSELDTREQEARIEKLRREAQKEDADAPTLVVEGLPEEFKV